MIYIITTTYRLAENKCHELEINPHDRSKVRIITRDENCRGIHLQPDDEHMFLALPGDWAERRTQELYEAWQYVVKTSELRNE